MQGTSLDSVATGAIFTHRTRNAQYPTLHPRNGAFRWCQAGRVVHADISREVGHWITWTLLSHPQRRATVRHLRPMWQAVGRSRRSRAWHDIDGPVRRLDLP